MERRNRRKWKIFLSSPITLIAAIVIMGLLAKADWDINRKAAESSAKLAQSESQLVSLRSEEGALSAKVFDLSTPGGMEAELKDKYHATAPGESVAVIVGSQSGDITGSTTPDASGSQSLWQRFLGMIGL